MHAVDVDRTVSAAGSASFGQHAVLAAEMLADRLVGIRVVQKTLMYFDPDTRQLPRTRPNSLVGGAPAPRYNLPYPRHRGAAASNAETRSTT